MIIRQLHTGLNAKFMVWLSVVVGVAGKGREEKVTWRQSRDIGGRKDKGSLVVGGAWWVLTCSQRWWSAGRLCSTQPVYSLQCRGETGTVRTTTHVAISYWDTEISITISIIMHWRQQSGDAGKGSLISVIKDVSWLCVKFGIVREMMKQHQKLI